jgi:hypothetical protein
MHTYSTKTYGRNEEVAIIYKLFEIDRDISMHGPRRLGKTFLLSRLADAASVHGWLATKVELAGLTDTRAVFRELCRSIGETRSSTKKAIDWIKQRVSQFVDPRTEAGGPWYQPFTGVDHEAYFERLVAAMHDDPDHRWILLIDELPIFLKVLHDKGPTGIAAARDFMNQISRLRENYPRVRWMITGSIGIEPLAQAGNYMGVLAKFEPFELKPLTESQAKDFVKDIAREGRLLHRQEVTDAEAQALIETVGWRAAYYLEALAQKLEGPPAHSAQEVKLVIEEALSRLIKLSESAKFGTWEEHLHKHYVGHDQSIAFSILTVLAQDARGADIDGLLSTIQRTDLTRNHLIKILMRLNTEGFIAVDNWEHEVPRCSFLNPLLRLWWRLAKPTQ